MAGQPGRRILMRCRKCSRHRYELPWIVRQYERRQSTTIVVDWDADEAIHTCRECAASDLGKANSHLLTPTVSNRVPLTCVTCGSDYESVASEAEERRTCSHWCSAIQKRKWRPWNPLQVRCLKEMARTKSPLTQFAQAVGIKEAMLGGWFRIEGRAISRAYLERIATYLGISVEQAIAEAGGITAEDGRSARGRARGEAFHTQAGTEASRRRLRPAQEAARRANHGRKQSPETVAKRLAARKATGGEAYTTDRLVEFKRSPAGRAVHSVLLRLRGILGRPAEAHLDAAYAAAAETSGLTVDAVKVAVRPYLLRHGLVSPGGRHREEARHDLIVNLLAERGRTPADDAPRGFWTETGPAFQAVKGTEGEKAPHSSESLYRWWFRYKRACPHCLAAVPVARTHDKTHVTTI